MLFGDLERRFSAYSSPVMLISTKMTRDKRVVTDFKALKHQNCKEQSCIPIGKRHIYNIGKFQM